MITSFGSTVYITSISFKGALPSHTLLPRLAPPIQSSIRSRKPVRSTASNMKLTAIPALTATALLSTAAVADARHAHVYTSSSPSAKWTESLSFSTFRSILAQRLGVSEYHTLDTTDADSLRALNAFQPSQKTLFADDVVDDPTTPELLIILEDVDNVDGLSL